MNCCSPVKVCLWKRTRARRALALIVCLSLLLASMPIPLGWKHVPRSNSTAFPCQSCHCSCSTAEQCWTNCCCYTPAERLAWAIENQVEPPSYAVLAKPAAGELSATQSLPTKCTALASGNCCAGEVTSSPTVACRECQPKRPAEFQSSCAHCQSTESPAVKPVPAHAPRSSASDVQTTQSVLVLSLSSIQCRGGSSQFTLLPWAIVQARELPCYHPEPLVAAYELYDERYLSLARVPDVPPPRV